MKDVSSVITNLNSRRMGTGILPVVKNAISLNYIIKLVMYRFPIICTPVELLGFEQAKSFK